MTFRRRVVLLSGLAVAVAVAAVSIATYLLVRSELRGRVDSELQRDVSETFAVPLLSSSDPPRLVIRRSGAGGRTELVPAGNRQSARAVRLYLPSGPLGGRSVYAQLVSSNGNLIRPRGPRTDLPQLADATQVAAGDRTAYFSDVQAGGSHLRVYTAQIEPGRAIQVARTLNEVDNTLSQLALILALVSLAGIGLAGVLGYFVARAAVTPVERLRRAAEQVATTRDLSRRIDATGSDELAALARSFNLMLNALESSLDAQRQLVADASHELRTPLASLRTNIEVLSHTQDIGADERRALLVDVIDQLEELTELVGDLVELARDAEHEQEPPEVVRLDLLVADAIERRRTTAGDVRFELDSEPTSVRAVERRLERAVANLLDNAVKWSPPGAQVEVRVGGGELSVRDHGAGIEPEDLPHIFDRFYRSAAARGLPGSGLGLAIVRQVAETQGGEVSVSNAEGGGATFTLRMPVFLPDSYRPLASV
ncbi:MAG: two-component system, OmpR family, sensor histidine kinase MprB [Solirubrobacterales bacterium]|jgi:two-component system sensor histidine kinase MprB|nr:two-component system, OmpR family, sensor histidine kinase MprB [Solirubrobacterales bacterium]